MQGGEGSSKAPQPVWVLTQQLPWRSRLKDREHGAFEPTTRFTSDHLQGLKPTLPQDKHQRGARGDPGQASRTLVRTARRS